MVVGTVWRVESVGSMYVERITDLFCGDAIGVEWQVQKIQCLRCR